MSPMTVYAAADSPAEAPRHDFAAAHTDPEREPRTVGALEVEVDIECGDCSLHAECRVERANCVILVRHGCTKHRHNRVTDVFVDRSLVAQYLARHRVEKDLQHVAQVLGVDALAQGRGTRQVREQNGHHAALLPEIDFGGAGNLA